ncbi:MAG: carboxypeptidase-like regulatory domain-containing protein, partial [Bacteroidota bacterium]
MLICSIVLMAQFSAQAQGIVRGKVFDEQGMGLPGAIIRLKEDPAVGTGTDFDGHYSLEIKSTTPVTLSVSYTGYETQEKQVNPINGE